jgi:hypothetical protein
MKSTSGSSGSASAASTPVQLLLVRLVRNPAAGMLF